MRNVFLGVFLFVVAFSSFAQTLRGQDYAGRPCEISVFKQNSDAMNVQIRFVDDRLGELKRDLILYKNQDFADRFSVLYMVDGDPVEWDASYVVGKNFRYSSYNAMTEKLVSTQCQKLRVVE